MASDEKLAVRFAQLCGARQDELRGVRGFWQLDGKEFDFYEITSPVALKYVDSERQEAEFLCGFDSMMRCVGTAHSSHSSDKCHTKWKMEVFKGERRWTFYL